MYGLMRLCYKVYGDCHTTFTADQDIYTLRQAIEDHSYDNVCSKNLLARLSARQIIPNWRTNAKKYKASGASYIPRDSNGLPAFEVIDGNKTAIIRFDSFVVDLDGWTAYYGTNPTTSPDPALVSLPDDSIGTFYKSFYAIEHEPDYAENVKNVLIDIATNSGGDSDALQFLLNYMIDSKDSSLLTLDVISGGKKILTARSDLNLDGKIDSNDKKKSYNFLIFTSLMSFSCGNAMPAICADNGIKIIGQKSGGGSCVVRFACTADDFHYQYSGLERVSRKDWSNVEGGIPVSEGGEIPYGEHMFDDDVLAGIVNALFP
ncbi:S41 family peptidase [uncultured Treponema sp.]|uniref:S41 family peptidase n=1 Tax=uncultured Treponema sp. TaxID=162155 RepID=UPI0025F2E881|nr:S41 family peptidase [uncultured Treponema sp.]